MTNLKQLLQYELKRDVPFTQDIEQRIINYRPKKRSNKLPLVAASFIAAAAAIMLFIIQFSQPEEATGLTFADKPKDVLMEASDIPKDVEGLVEILKKNETVLPFKERAAENEVLYSIEDFDPIYSGQNFNLYMLNVFITKDAAIDKGNYVLFEQEGSLHVRQVLAFEGETYRKRQGELFVDGKKVMLPGLLNDTSYDFTSTYKNAWYFDLIQQADKTMTDDVQINDGEILVYSTSKKVETIPFDSILGKVTGVQYEKPTFFLTDDAAKVAEQFKETLNVELLKQLEIKEIAQLYLQGLYERNAEMLYAMVPTTIQKEEITLDGFITLYVGEEALISDANAVKAIIASSYNGVENGEVKYGMFDESYAMLSYKKDLKKLENHTPYTISFFKNELGFWELRNPILGVIY